MPGLAIVLLIAAAADLVPLEHDLAQAFEKKTGFRVRFTFGSSGMLARQIENGAPYDVYLSANASYVNELSESGHLARGTTRTYAFGRLGLFGVKELRDLAGPKVRKVAIPNPKHAPYGVAAVETLRQAGLLAEVEPKIVYGENVRQTYEYARTGNTDAAITAWTLVKDAGGVLLPDSNHAPIEQRGGVVRSSGQAAAARAFLEFLGSVEGRAILTRYGLTPPR
jgi:molybdate transport system substrate-binding protein